MLRWTSLALLAAAGIVLWSSWPARAPERGPIDAPREPPASASTARPDHELVAGGERVPVTSAAEPDAPEPAPTPPPAEADGERAAPPRSARAWQLSAVAASFTTDQPRVVELLDLVAVLAAEAVLDADGIALGRGQGGDAMSAAGALAVGDLRGTFLADADGYTIAFQAPTEDARWARADVRIHFQADPEGVRGCAAVVQFQPAAAGEPGSGGVLVGWALTTVPGVGSAARPLLLRPGNDGWEHGDPESLPAQEFPWLESTAGYEAWLRLLEPHWAAAGLPR